jgi:hypothetical protein
MEKLIAELGVDPNDIVMFILAWILGAKSMGEFSREEWIEGLTALKYVEVLQLLV